jgi:predicted GNAT family N-acyltransferase
VNAGNAGFRVDAADYAADRDALRTVREAVFVREQGVPLELELDALDPDCLHVLARDADGRPIGTGRLTPAHRLGRMAVLPEWRGRGVGAAMLEALTALALARRWRAIELHAQAGAIGFYARHGYLPFGPRFVEAGIEHQAMRRVLQGPNAVEDREGAIAATTAIVEATRRGLRVYSRALDPGLFDAPPVLEALRRLAVRGDGVELRFLLQDADMPQREHAPLIALAQRLPSVVLFRAVDDPVDLAYPSAFVANDGGGYYFRGLGHRFDGETALDAPGRARQLREAFDRTWERSRPCSEYRALGL